MPPRPPTVPRPYTVSMEGLSPRSLRIIVQGTGPLDDLSIVIAAVQDYVNVAFPTGWRPTSFEIRDHRVRG